LYDILPDDPKEAAAIRRKSLNSITMLSQGHCIADRMMESSPTACHTKRHRKYSKRLITACVELTNLVQNLEIDPEDSDIIGKR